MTPDELAIIGKEALARIKHLGAYLKIDEKVQQTREIEEKMLAPNFWDKREEAQQLMGALSICKNVCNPYNRLCRQVEDFAVQCEFAKEDPEMCEEASAAWGKLSVELEQVELLSFLSGKFDGNNAYFSIHAGAYLKIDEKVQQTREIEEKMLAPNFWDKREEAQQLMGMLSICKNVCNPYNRLCRQVEDFAVQCEFAKEDPEMCEEASSAWTKLSVELEQVELLSFLSGKFDGNNAYFSIHAGAGGTESCDWASMLMRMYRRWFERRGWKDEIIDIQQGDEAGIKSVTIRVEGEFAYGYSRAENGVHRLVRISPFDSNARRHTSFASVDVFPEISDDVEVEIDEKDLRVDTYRSSGAGGQHVNTTDSAIRITHIPTNIIVACQAERSQHKNRATAMKMLKARLYERQEEERRKEADQIRGVKTENSWGNQIRSYVLHPYQMVKDLRTDVETGNTAAVLDGDLDRFVEAWLKSTTK